MNNNYQAINQTPIIPEEYQPHLFMEPLIDYVQISPYKITDFSNSRRKSPENTSKKMNQDFHMLLALESGIYLQDWNEIAWARSQNYSYGAIARATGLSPACIKMYCNRHGIKAPGPRRNKAQNSMLVCCHYCGKLFSKKINRDVTFCSSLCRNRYHNNLEKCQQSIPEDGSLVLLPDTLCSSSAIKLVVKSEVKDTPKAINKDWTSPAKRVINRSEQVITHRRKINKEQT